MAFGILKLNYADYSRDRIIIIYCFLHNICQFRGDDYIDDAELLNELLQGEIIQRVHHNIPNPAANQRHKLIKKDSVLKKCPKLMR